MVVRNDVYCWLCHSVCFRDMQMCSTCPRTTHKSCLKSSDRERRICPECQLIRSSRVHKRPGDLSRTSLSNVMFECLENIRIIDGMEYFQSSESSPLSQTGPSCHPLFNYDLDALERKIARLKFRSMQSFVSSVKWFDHLAICYAKLYPTDHRAARMRLAASRSVALASECMSMNKDEPDAKRIRIEPDTHVADGQNCYMSYGTSSEVFAFLKSCSVVLNRLNDPVSHSTNGDTSPSSPNCEQSALVAGSTDHSPMAQSTFRRTSTSIFDSDEEADPPPGSRDEMLNKSGGADKPMSPESLPSNSPLVNGDHANGGVEGTSIPSDEFVSDEFSAVVSHHNSDDGSPLAGLVCTDNTEADDNEDNEIACPESTDRGEADISRDLDGANLDNDSPSESDADGNKMLQLKYYRFDPALLTKNHDDDQDSDTANDYGRSVDSGLISNEDGDCLSTADITEHDEQNQGDVVGPESGTDYVADIDRDQFDNFEADDVECRTDIVADDAFQEEEVEDDGQLDQGISVDPYATPAKNANNLALRPLSELLISPPVESVTPPLVSVEVLETSDGTVIINGLTNETSPSAPTTSQLDVQTVHAELPGVPEPGQTPKWIESLAESIKHLVTREVELQPSTALSMQKQIEKLRQELADERAAKETSLKVVEELKNGMKEYELKMKVRFKTSIRQVEAQMKQRLEQAILETKTKQWCKVCLKIANLHCCCSTFYCTTECQRQHWPDHRKSCARRQMDTELVQNTLPPAYPAETQLVGQPNQVARQHAIRPGLPSPLMMAGHVAPDCASAPTRPLGPDPSRSRAICQSVVNSRPAIYMPATQALGMNRAMISQAQQSSVNDGLTQMPNTSWSISSPIDTRIQNVYGNAHILSQAWPQFSGPTIQ